MERIATFLIEKETISGKEFMELYYELRPEAKAEAERIKAEKEAAKAAAEEATATEEVTATEECAAESAVLEEVKDADTISFDKVMDEEECL